MRWLFIFLLVLNFFSWFLGGRLDSRTRNEASASLPLGGGEGVRLVSEAGLAIRLKEGGSRKDECLFLGGFQSEERGRQVVQRLLNLDIASGLEQVERIVATDYWVYLPPLASRQASLLRLRELQAKKIDSYVIVQGDLANGISLGVFSRAESAEAAMLRFRGAGYETVMRELPRVRHDYWVKVSPESTRLFDVRLIEGLERSFPGLRHQQRECGGVASRVRLE